MLSTRPAVTAWNVGLDVVTALDGGRPLLAFATDYRGPLVVVFAARCPGRDGTGTIGRHVELVDVAPPDPDGLCAWTVRRLPDLAAVSAPTGDGIYGVPAGVVRELPVAAGGAA